MSKENKKDNIPLVIVMILLFFFLASGYSCTTISKVQQIELEGIELDYHCQAIDRACDDCDYDKFLQYHLKATNWGNAAERKIDNRKIKKQ